jgi:hypothetical protein
VTPARRPRRRPLATALRDSLEAVEHNPEDAAARDLALTYAAAIDAARLDVDTLTDLGPKLLTVLAELGMTPRARAGVLRHLRDDDDADDGILDDFRARRLRLAEAVDAPAAGADAEH